MCLKKQTAVRMVAFSIKCRLIKLLIPQLCIPLNINRILKSKIYNTIFVIYEQLVDFYVKIVTKV